MRIDFECSGGYGGLFAARPLRYSAEIEALPEARRDDLRKLVEASGLLASDAATAAVTAAATAKPGQARDLFNYRLSLVGPGVSKSFAFDDMTAPPEALPLLNYLRRLAIEERQA